MMSRAVKVSDMDVEWCVAVSTCADGAARAVAKAARSPAISESDSSDPLGGLDDGRRVTISDLKL